MLGDQTILIGTVAQSASPGYLGLATETRTDVTVTGCRGRVLSATETAELALDATTEIWKWTLPAGAAATALAAGSTGEIVWDGTIAPTRTATSVWQIHGPIQPVYDLDGTVHHIRIIAKRQAG